jgi:hypothetical protein
MATIDERLEALVQSTELLQQTVMKHDEQMDALRHEVERLVDMAADNERRWQRLGRALMAGFREYFDEGGNNGQS